MGRNFYEPLDVIKTRSTCLRRQVAAVIVRIRRLSRRIQLGAPKGVFHCEQCGLPARPAENSGRASAMKLCRGIHAEQNAIIQASVHGVSIEGSDIYITHSPCILCSKMLINAGIKRIVYQGDYPDKLALDMLDEAGVTVVKYITPEN